MGKDGRVTWTPLPSAEYCEFWSYRACSVFIIELGRDLEKALNKKLKTGNLPNNVVFIPVAREEMISKLAAGYADIGGTIAEREQAAQVDYTEPLIPDAEGVVVTGPAAPAISRLEDLSGQEIYAQENTAIWDKLVEPNEQFRKAGKAPVKLVAADPCAGPCS